MGKMKREVHGSYTLRALKNELNQQLASGQFDASRQDKVIPVTSPAELESPYTGGFSIEAEKLRGVVVAKPIPKPHSSKRDTRKSSGPVITVVNRGYRYSADTVGAVSEEE